MSDPSVEIRRSVGEAFGMLSRIDGDHLANELVKFLTMQVSVKYAILTSGGQAVQKYQH